MVDEIDVLRALAHPVRWGILERLAAEPGICACTFTEYFNVSQPTISAHLKALRQAGLVTTQRRGTEIWYSLARDQLAPLAGRLSGIASPGAPVAQAPGVQATVPQTTVPQPTVPQATVPYAAERRARAQVPAADAQTPGRLADVVAPAMAAAARMSGGPADPPLAKRATGGLAAAAAAAQAAAQAARRSGGDDVPAAARPAVPQRSRALADMAALAQAAVPRGAGRRGRIPRQRGARASVAAGRAED
jgi:ArsR family transcriptional regulator